jgi:hypothetical protein
MDEASSLLEKLQLPKGYRKLSPNPSLVMSAKVVDLVPSSVSPTLHPKSSKVIAPVTSSVNPTLPLKSAYVVDPIPS